MMTTTATPTDHQNSAAMSTNVNLYCAQCESQIGIFNNEWIRLTSSYARSKERGTHFGTEVGNRMQVVPSGPAQRSAEGCMMAEVFCRKCSNMVGQYCKSAPDVEKQPLANQYFYKLSRTFLKDSRTNVRIEPMFGYGSDIVKPPSSQSSTMPRLSMTPTSRWANTPLRQSSRTPAVSSQATNRSSARRDSQDTPINMAELSKTDRLEQTTDKIAKLQEEMFSQQSTLLRQAGEISAHTTKLENQETRLRDQQAEIREYESCQSAQAARIVEQDQMIQIQTKTIEQQQHLLSTITHQLTKLQKTMDDLKQTLLDSKHSSSTDSPTISRTSSNLETAEENTRNSENNARELQTLRAENRAMKSRLDTIADAMSTSADTAFSANLSENPSLSTTLQAKKVLGKRKRNEAGRHASLELGSLAPVQTNAVAHFLNNAEQMPTPQSSDGGQRSLENSPPNTNTHLTRKRRAVRQSDNVELDITTSNSSCQPSRSSKAMETAHTDDESSILDPPHTEVHRVTRATSRILQSTEGEVDQQQETVAVEVEDWNLLFSPMQTADLPGPLFDAHDVVQGPLPSVQAASNVLGMNLEALIASSRALTKQTSAEELELDVELTDSMTQAETRTQTRQKANASQQNHESTSELVEPLTISSHPVEPPMQDTVTSSFDESEQAKDNQDAIDFVQDFGIDDIIDTSDDDDDSMALDTDLYGEDFTDADAASSPEQDDDGLPQLGQTHHSRRVAAPPVIRQDRSMAPEPKKKPKSKRAPVREYISLDRIHMATPKMFTDAYAAGQQPRTLLPPGLPTRERRLNEELMQLGLSHWIGKRKNTKEYRVAVTAARARLRNSKKAAFLLSKGLNHNPSDPAATLPLEHIGPQQNDIQTMPLSSIENVPASAPIASGTAVVTDKEHEQNQEATKQIPRATRASTRRSSVHLVSGLEETESQAADTEGKQVTRKRKSDGRRKSNRKSQTTSTSEKPCDSTQPDNDEPQPFADGQADEATTAVVVETRPIQELDLEKRKSSARAQGRSRRSAASETVANSVSQSKDTIIDVDEQINEQIDARAVSIQAATKLTPEAAQGVNGNDKATLTQDLSAQNEAQLREEAIMLRDRMAKELMELEDLDM